MAPTATSAARGRTSTSTTSTLSAARVAELGGEAGEATPVPSMGWFAICKDPEGNEFGLWQTDPDASMPDA